jgi:hypothetical protein
MKEKLIAMMVCLMNTKRKRCRVSYATEEEALHGKGWIIAHDERNPEYYNLFFYGSFWRCRKSIWELVKEAENAGILIK